jgi:hypothetical protein
MSTVTATLRDDKHILECPPPLGFVAAPTQIPQPLTLG